MSLLIRNVKIIGGPKNLPEKSDVFVSGEKISAIGQFPGKTADEVADGAGAYLLPGIIDVDATSDHHLTLLTDPGQEDFLRQGVTTVIGGHCGASLAPLLYGGLEAIRKWADPEEINVNWRTVGEFLGVLDKRPLGVNFGTLTGHSTVRRAVIGEDIRDLTPNEIKVMGGVLERSLQEGAFGVSLGLEYVHTRSTPYAEIKTFAELLPPRRGVLSVHLRRTGAGIDQATAEILKLQRETGASILLSHFVPIVGAEADYEKALAMLSALPPEADVHADMYPFAGVVLAIYRLLPEWAQNGNLELMQKNIEDAWLAKRILSDLPELNPDSLTVEASRNPILTGKTLREFMEISGKTEPRAALLELMRALKLHGVVSWRNVNETVLEKALDHPRALIGSHSAALKTPAADDSFRTLRSRKTFTKFLERAESQGKLTEAVRRITAEPARKFGLKGRGEVREGYIADLTVWSAAEGVKCVAVGGKVAVRNGGLTGTLSGRPLRRGA